MVVGSKRVFIVHGHNHRLRDEVSAHVRSLGLEPVILTDQVNRGETVIEKFEREAVGSDYAIVLLTGDDAGGDWRALLPTFTTPGLGVSLLNAASAFMSLGMAAANQLTDAVHKIEEDLLGISEYVHAQAVGPDFKLPGGKLKPRARQNVILELGFFIGRLGRQHVCVLADPNVEAPSDLIGIVTVSTADNWKTALEKELRAAGMFNAPDPQPSLPNPSRRRSLFGRGRSGQS
jgi:hypothetical protein